MTVPANTASRPEPGLPPAEIVFATEHDSPFARDLLDYVADVADALGVGLESTTVDPGVPASAYVALTCTLPDRPDHDVAMVWEESAGWSAVVETPTGDLVTIAHFGADPVPEPDAVGRFVTDLRAGRPAGGPAYRGASSRAAIAGRLARRS